MWAISIEILKTDKVRQVIIGLLFLTGCRTIDIDYSIKNNRDLTRITSTLCDFREQKKRWPTQEQWDSIRTADKKFGHATKSDIKTTGDTLITQSRIEYDKYESPIKAVEISQSLAFYDSGYSYSQESKIVDGRMQGGFAFHTIYGGCYSNDIKIIESELQTGINLGQRTTLTKSEKQGLKNWNKELKKYLQSKYVTVQELKSNKEREIHLNEELAILTKTDTLHPLILKWDSVNRKYESEYVGEWHLTKVDSKTNSITVTNYTLDESREIPLTDIEYVLYANKRQIRHNQIAGIAFAGTLIWGLGGVASEQDDKLNIAAFTLSAASLVYLIQSIKKTGDKKYKVIEIRD